MKRKKLYLVPILALMFVLSWSLSGVCSGDGVVNTSVHDFRVNLDRTITDTSKAVNVVVELLDEQGRVDVFAETSVDYIYVSAGSVIGTINYSNKNATSGKEGSGNDGGSFAAETAKIAVENGRAGFNITYNQPGTDTLRFYVVIVDTDGDTLTLGPKEYQIQVTEAPNQAEALQLISMTPDDTTGDNKEITYNATTPDATDDGNGQIDAGEAFTLKIKACEDSDCTDYTSYQNGPITIKFIPETTTDSDGNSAYSADCSNVVTVNGTMENGVAFVHVPEETLTKAGEYKIYAEMDSAVTPSGKAKLVENKHIWVDALGPVKVKASLDRNYINDSNIKSPTLTLSLIDKYGNLADKDDVTSNVDVTVSATNNVLLDGSSSKTITISGNNTKSFNNFTVNTGDKAPSTSDDTGTGTSILNISCSDYEVDTPELTLTIYKKKLVVNIKDGNFTAGIVKESAIQVCAGDDGNSTIDSANCTELESKRVKVELYNGNTKVDEVTSVVGDNGTVNLKFTKALEGDGNETLKVFYLSSGYQYEPGEDTGTITVNPADAYVMKLYKNRSSDYDACAGTGTATEEINSITKTLSNDSAAITIHGSEDSSLSYSDYFIKIEDAYGNEIKNGTIYVESDADPLTPSITKSQFYINDDNITVTYNKVGTDNLTFYTDIPGVDGITVPVTITETTVSLTSIEVIPATDYVLTNGEIPVVVRAKDENGNLIDWDNNDLTLLVDHPNYVTIREKDRSTEIQNGDTLPASNGEYVLSLLASNTEGDVTITIRNASGSVQGQATVHIVGSVNDIPAAVSQVSFSPDNVTIAPNESVNATLQVVDSEGNGVANKICTLDTDAENVAEPASTTVTTGNDGTVEITINAGSVEGVAHITATCEGQSAVLTATVTSAITLSQNNVTVTQGNTATVTVSGGTAPYTVSSSDENIATAEVSDDTITITGVAEGTATITVTDSSDPAKTAEIQVTVKAGAAPQPVPTEPTVEEITDVSTAPVNLGEVASGTGDTMEMTVNFPAYENAVDIYVGILLPTGDLYVLQSDNTFTLDLVPYAENVTDAVSAQVFEPFSVCTPFGPAIPEGTYNVYTLVVPTGADLATMDWASAPYDLSYYSFDVSCD